MNMQLAEADLVAAQKQQVHDLTGVDLEHIILNEIGWTSRVYVVSDGKFVVKFPRREEVKKEYQQEVKIYQLLNKLEQGAVQVPKLRWVHPHNDYIGYEGIQGVDYESVAKTITPDHQATIGRALGNFLKQLHRLHLEEPYVMTVDDEIAQFQTKYQAALPVIRQNTSVEEQVRIKQFIAVDMPAEMRRLGSTPMLCHGDLGYWNLIFKQDGEIGVIDFGDIGYYDASKDFCGLQDEAMLNAAITVYGDSDALRQRIAIRKKAILFLDLQYYVESNNQAKVHEILEEIKKKLDL